MRGRNVEEAVYSIEFIAVEVYKHRVGWVVKFPEVTIEDLKTRAM